MMNTGSAFADAEDEERERDPRDRLRWAQHFERGIDDAANRRLSPIASPNGIASAHAIDMLTTMRPTLMPACSKSSRSRARSTAASSTVSGEGSRMGLSVQRATTAQPTANTSIVRR
jgi:hypothetical protein